MTSLIKKSSNILALGIILLALVLTSALPRSPVSDRKKNNQQVIQPGMNSEFAWSLYSKLREQEGNLFFSPYSISSALAMAYTGARGETEKQIASVMHFPSAQKQLQTSFAALSKSLNGDGLPRSYQLNVANALWKEKSSGFLSDFLETAKNAYGAGINELDFAGAPENSRMEINRWVEQQTQEKIKDLLPPGSIRSVTRLVLTNAIYFKGDWANKFKKEETKNADFMVTTERKVTAPLMHEVAHLNYTEGPAYQALELPYAGKQLSMVVLLPRQIDGLAAVENLLTADRLQSELSNLPVREVVVYLPKFKSTASFELGVTLAEMGMPLAFKPEADFSGIDGRRDLFLSMVVHKAYVDVDEEGTEAAGATGVVAELTSAKPRPPVFRADHPFIFLIRENRSGSILFMGRVTNPLNN